MDPNNQDLVKEVLDQFAGGGLNEVLNFIQELERMARRRHEETPPEFSSDGKDLPPIPDIAPPQMPELNVPDNPVQGQLETLPDIERPAMAISGAPDRPQNTPFAEQQTQALPELDSLATPAAPAAPERFIPPSSVAAPPLTDESEGGAPSLPAPEISLSSLPNIPEPASPARESAADVSAPPVISDSPVPATAPLATPAGMGGAGVSVTETPIPSLPESTARPASPLGQLPTPGAPQIDLGNPDLEPQPADGRVFDGQFHSGQIPVPPIPQQQEFQQQADVERSDYGDFETEYIERSEQLNEYQRMSNESTSMLLGMIQQQSKAMSVLLGRMYRHHAQQQQQMASLRNVPPSPGESEG